jgi:hypothetical protein
MPVFSPAAAGAEDDAAAADEGDVAPVVGADGLELDELHAASRIDTATSGTASPAVCLSFI